MQDINITVNRQKIELKWLAASFVIAFLLNVISVIIYQTSWSELWTQLLWVLILTLIIYVLSIAARVAVYLIRRLFRK